MRRSTTFFKVWQRERIGTYSDGGTTVAINEEPMHDDGGAALTEIYRGENPEVDIIAVHGINGDAFSTFSTQSGKRFWLGDQDMLPRDVKNSRILTYRYPASVASVLGSASSDRILQHAQTLIAELVADRELENALERPIIFICHSLGGIVVKRALVYSASRTSRDMSHLRSIYTSTYGILFFGTPHQGSKKVRLARFAQRTIRVLVPSKLVDTQSQLLDALREGSEVLQEISDNFVPLMKDLRIFFFWEQEKTDCGYKLDYIVTESSAAPILDNTDRAGLRADHRNMCRFASRNAPGYRMVASCLLRYTRDAPQTISRKWDVEKERVHSLRQQEMKRLHEEMEQETTEDVTGMRENNAALKHRYRGSGSRT